MLHLAANEVQTRQQLNARHAISLAHARGIDWLLHIDADELFYPGPRGDAATHFRALSQRDVATFCYYNHEAVPETHGIVDPFREVTLFKRSLEVVERSDRAAAAVDFWQTRQEGSFFYYYDNGKAAVRVRPGARPLSVHEWIPGSADGMQHWYSNMREPWDGRGELGRIVQHMESDACILHYPCYNAESSNLTATTPANMQWSDPNIPYAIIISLGAGLATGIGGSLVFVPDLMKRVSQAMILAVSLALSAGVMIYVSFIEIFGKSYEAIAGTEGVSEGGAAAITTLCFFAGMGFCALLEVLVHWMSKKSGAEVPCPAHGAHGAGGDTTTASIASQQSSEGEQCETGTGGLSAPGVKVEIVTDKTDANHGDLIGNPEEAVNLSKMGLMTALAIAIHNFPEGLATFLATLGDVKLGASLGVAIAVHNIPEGLCVAMPIYYATGSRWKALTYSLLSGVTEPIGGILGFAILQPVFTPLLFGIVFAMVGGMMVFIVCHELLPAAHSYMASGSNFVFGSAKAETTAWLICGMVIMAISLVLFVV